MKITAIVRLGLSISCIMLSACSERPAQQPAHQDSVTVTDSHRATSVTPPSPSPTSAAPIVWRAHRTYDLTGDGRPETINVSAAGPSYDSLDVLLEIRSPSEVPLYSARWNSRLYFVYDHRAGKADSTVERLVRNHLTRLLADSAFTHPRSEGLTARIDTPSVEYDLAELRVRAEHHIADTQVVTGAAYEEVQKTKIPLAFRNNIIQDIITHPRFTYFAGGEVTYTIAWSDKLEKFVKTFSCC